MVSRTGCSFLLSRNPVALALKSGEQEEVNEINGRVWLGDSELPLAPGSLQKLELVQGEGF